MNEAKPRFKLKNHIAYNGWKYALLVVFSVLSWSLIFTITEYRSPPELTVEAYFMSEYLPDDQLAVILEEVKPYLPDMETVNILSPVMAGDEYSLQQYLMVKLGAGEGDVFVVDEALFRQIANQGGAQPLDELILDGLIKPGDIDLSSSTFAIYEIDNDGNAVVDPSVPEHIYGLPMGTLYGFITENSYDIRGKYGIIMAYSRNQDNAAKMLQAFIDEKSAPRPDWLDEYEQSEGK